MRTHTGVSLKLWYLYAIILLTVSFASFWMQPLVRLLDIIALNAGFGKMTGSISQPCLVCTIVVILKRKGGTEVAKTAMLCPFSNKLCKECAYYRGRHYYLCFSKEYRGHIGEPGEEKDTRDRRKPRGRRLD